MADQPFAVSGTFDGEPATISWDPDGGFDDPTGQVAALIDGQVELGLTATGPWLVAGASPARVALLTAKQALETVEALDEQARVYDGDLDALAVVPDGATP